MKPLPLSPKQQNGSALIVSLSILLILTILGVSAMRTTSLEEKMAGNSRDSQVAFEAAEAALRAAEMHIDSNNTSAYNDTGATGYFTSINAEAWDTEASWNNAVSSSYDTYQVALAPRYIIQLIDSGLTVGNTPEVGAGYGGPSLKGIDVFQITARGSGISPNSRAMLQTYYGKIQ